VPQKNEKDWVGFKIEAVWRIFLVFGYFCRVLTRQPRLNENLGLNERSQAKPGTFETAILRRFSARVNA
jgi:hypothetical protein